VLQTTKLLLAICAVSLVLEGSASAQGMLTASVGNVFGGDTPSKKGTYAIAIGGGGSHGIGSELEFSQTRNFFETADGLSRGNVLTLMASVFVMVPVNRIKPYGIFGFGFIRQRTEASVGGVFSELSDNDAGYSVGGGLTYQFARVAGVRADLRHFKVRKADGLSFQRFLVGIVLGG
jgi:opacity protein-like surface antigen